jgi:enoyl-CoA hydratase/carnithine racemase
MSVIKMEKRGHVALVTFNRPEMMNALGQIGDGDEIHAMCDAINDDQSIRCVVLTGSGRAFSAGGDLKAMRDRSGAFSGSGPELWEGYRQNIHRMVKALYGLEVPTIAAINGPAIGLGCDIACLMDIRIASETATFGATFLKVGLIPGDGGAWILPRTIGMSRACELLFTGSTIDAATAERWGLVTRIVRPDDLASEALALGETISMQPPHALRLTKSLLRQGRSASLESLMELSKALQVIAHKTEDHLEGVNAVLERRPAVFVGR